MYLYIFFGNKERDRRETILERDDLDTEILDDDLMYLDAC